MPEPLVVLPAVIACTALIGLWLWVSPDIRAWLAGHFDRAWQAAKPYRGRLVAAISVVAILVTLVTAGIGAALPWAITVCTIALSRQAMRDDAAQISFLEDGINRVARTRDAYADALRHILRAPDLDAVRAIAHTALETGSYPGDLATAREVVATQAAEIEQLRAALDQADHDTWASS